MLRTYKYIDPLENGFKKVHLTKKQHNRLFPNRPRKWYLHYDYYLSHDSLKIHETQNLVSKLITLLTLPLALLWFGIENAKETLKEHTLYLFNAKKYGKHIEHVVWRRSDKYLQVVNELVGTPRGRRATSRLL